MPTENQIMFVLSQAMDADSAKAIAERIAGNVVKDIEECAGKDWSWGDLYLGIGRSLCKEVNCNWAEDPVACKAGKPDSRLVC